MVFIILITGIIYLILISWSWQNLGELEKSKKVIYLIAGIAISYVITLIVFQIAKGKFVIEEAEIQNRLQNMIVAIFTGINGMIVMPQIAKIIDRQKGEQVEKQEILKRIGIILIVFVVCLIIETGYMRDTQEGTLRMYQTIKE